MKKLLFILFILLPFQLLLSQDRVDIQKIFDIAMDSIIQKNPKDFYYLGSDQMLTSSKKALSNDRECGLDYTSFDFQVNIKENISFLDERKIKPKNFINKLLYGNRLKLLTVFKPWENQKSEWVLILIISDKEMGKEYRIVFNKLNYNVLEFCELSFIH